ncbi:MAG: hypothetical protein Q9218_000312 [Villophora microphyllina]
MAQMQVKTVQKRKLKQEIASVSSTKVAQELDIQQEQQQSFEIVHTVLHSSLAQLAYLRHLFPEDCFTDRSFDDIREEAQRRYRDQIDDAFRRKKRTGHATTEGADGILEGVRKRNITAAQFSICPDQANRAKVIESYTFRFHYDDRKDQSDQAVATVTVSGLASVPISIRDVRNSLMDLMKLIANYTEKMPDLPGTFES